MPARSGAVSFALIAAFLGLALAASFTLGSCFSAGRRDASNVPADFIFDPTRDPVKDLAAARDEARATGKRVLIEVGGDWCPWCRALERFFQENRDLVELRDRSFVWVKVFRGSGAGHPPALAAYPEGHAVPHFYVLDPDGRLLRSQDSDPLEAGNGYDRERVAAFLRDWAPPGATPAPQR